MPPTSAATVREFRVDPGARRRDAVKGVLKTVAIVLGFYVVLRLATGAPLFSFAYSDLVLLVVPVLFFARGRWGDRLLLDEQALRVYRGEELRRTIPLDAIQRVSGGASSFTVSWSADGRTGRQLITKEGFTDGEWSQIRSLLGRAKDT